MVPSSIPSARSSILLATAICLFFFQSTTSAAQESFLPNLEIVFGDEQAVVELRASDLDHLPQQSIETHSPYYKGSVEFSGPILADLLNSVAGGDIEDNTRISLYALNNYFVHTTVGELKDVDALLATRKEGDRLSIRERGPYWVILPLSEREELDSEHYHKLMVWQLYKIRLGDQHDRD